MIFNHLYHHYIIKIIAFEHLVAVLIFHILNILFVIHTSTAMATAVGANIGSSSGAYIGSSTGAVNLHAKKAKFPENLAYFQ